MTLNLKNCGFVLAGFLLLSTTARADVLLSNLTEPERSFSTLDGSLWAAQSFATDANAYRLTNIQAIVGDETGSAGAFAQLRCSTLSGDVDTSAGGLISLFTVPDLSGARSVRTFSPSSAVILAPNTNYYFLLGAGRNGSYAWAYAEGNGSTGPGSFGNFEYSSDSGDTWTNFGADNPFYLQVNVTSAAAPEPGTLSLLSIGMTGASVVLRRRKR